MKNTRAFFRPLKKWLQHSRTVAAVENNPPYTQPPSISTEDISKTEIIKAMEYIRACFGGFKDWIHRHPVSFSSPSGLSKTWILLQVSGQILYETGSHIVAPFTGYRVGFTVTRLKDVENFDDLVAKAKEKNITVNFGKDKIDDVFKNLKKKKNFPFFASDDQEDTTDPSPPQDLKTCFPEGLESPNDVTVIRLTEIRDHTRNFTRAQNPTSQNEEEKKLVPRDGSYATSLILFVHSQRPQTDPADKVDNNPETVTTNTTLTTGSEPSKGLSPGSEEEVVLQLPEDQFRLFEYNDNKWLINKGDVDNICLGFAKKVLDDYLQNEENPDRSKLDMSVWQRIMALLLIKTNELIKGGKLKGPVDVVSFLNKFSKMEGWKDIQDSAKDVLEKSLIDNLSPIVICLHDNGRILHPDACLRLWKTLSGMADPSKKLFESNTADGCSTAERCPICSVGFNPKMFQGHIDDHLAAYREVISPQSVVPEMKECPFCSDRPVFKDLYGFPRHFKKFHSHLLPEILSPLVGIGLYECSHCRPAGIRLFKSRQELLAHFLIDHEGWVPREAPPCAPLTCNACPQVKVFKSNKSLYRHFNKFHQKLLAPPTIEQKIRWYTCPRCPESAPRYTSKQECMVHLLSGHVYSDQPSTSTPSLKRPVKQTDNSSKSKKISSTQNASRVPSHSPSVNASSTDRPSVIQAAPRSSASDLQRLPS